MFVAYYNSVTGLQLPARQDNEITSIPREVYLMYDLVTEINSSGHGNMSLI